MELAQLEAGHAIAFALEIALWAGFVVSCIVVTPRIFRELASAPHVAWLGGCIVVGLALRSVLPFMPQNWYFGAANLNFPPELFQKATVVQPLPNVLVLFALGSANGLRLLNLLAGVAAIPLLAYAVQRAHYPARVVRIMAVLVAVTPFYVRYSASDGPQIMILFLFACAAAAYVRLATGAEDWPEWMLLVSAVILAAPIRVESTLPLLAVPFFLFHGAAAESPRGVWHGRPTMVLGLAWIAGVLWSLAFHTGDLTRHPWPDAVKIVLRLATDATMIINPVLVPWIPYVLLVPIWMEVVHLWRRRAWREAASLYAPVVFCSIPAFAVGPTGGLVVLGYLMVESVFVLLASARCMDAVLTRAPRATPRRWAVAAAVAPLILASFVYPLTCRYSFEEEFRFLRAVLPKEPATILSIYDVRSQGSGDYNCCLTLPYPVLMAERPYLKWVVLTRNDLDSEQIRGLKFDYYYPGSLVAADLDAVDRWLPHRVRRNFGLDDPEAARHREHLVAIKKLDEQIRALYPLEVASTISTPVNGLGDAEFPDGNMSLVFYRRIQPAREDQ